MPATRYKITIRHVRDCDLRAIADIIDAHHVNVGTRRVEFGFRRVDLG